VNIPSARRRSFTSTILDCGLERERLEYEVEVCTPSWSSKTDALSVACWSAGILDKSLKAMKRSDEEEDRHTILQRILHRPRTSQTIHQTQFIPSRSALYCRRMSEDREDSIAIYERS